MVKTARRALLKSLKDHIEAENVSVQQIADYCDCKTETVERILDGHFSPSLDQLLMICEAANACLAVTEKRKS